MQAPAHAIKKERVDGNRPALQAQERVMNDQQPSRPFLAALTVTASPAFIPSVLSQVTVTLLPATESTVHLAAKTAPALRTKAATIIATTIFFMAFSFMIRVEVLSTPVTQYQTIN
jgi:hypothetical protein